MSTANVAEQIDSLSASHYNRFPIVLKEARDVWIWDTDGHKYLDFLSTYSAINVGHNHPRILKVIGGKYPTSSHAFRTVQELDLLRELTRVSCMDAALPMNTGAEAVETSIKLIRKWAYSRKGIPMNVANIVVANSNFHGRTIAAISASDYEHYKYWFGPYTPGFTWVPFGDIEALERLLSGSILQSVAAVILEPIQGEGGINVPPAGYLTAVKELCQRNNILFVLDEVQTGFGRTGKMFAFQHENCKPDLLVVAKALGGGVMPVSAVLGSRELMNTFIHGEHGSTWGGHARACAIGAEAIRIIEDEGLCENAERMGTYLMNCLLRACTPYYVREVRGRGLLIGVEFTEEGGKAYDWSLRLLKRGVLCMEARGNVLRLTPPLTIKKRHIDQFMARFSAVMNDIERYRSY